MLKKNMYYSNFYYGSQKRNFRDDNLYYR